MKKFLCLLLLLPLLAACGGPDLPPDVTGEPSSTADTALYDITLYDCRSGAPKEHVWSSPTADLTPENLLVQLGDLLKISVMDVTVSIEGNKIAITLPPGHPVIFSSDYNVISGFYDSLAKTFRHNYGDEKSVYFSLAGVSGEPAPYVYSWETAGPGTPSETTPPAEEGTLSQADAADYALNLAVSEFGDGLGLFAEFDGVVSVEGIRCYIILVYQPGADFPLRQFAIGLNNERVFQYSHYQQKYIAY